MDYFCPDEMTYYNWNTDKNTWLKTHREITFEEIVVLIHAGRVLAVEVNPRYPHQKMYVVQKENYALVVPFVENGDEIFLKTAFFSRKHTQRYLSKGAS